MLIKRPQVKITGIPVTEVNEEISDLATEIELYNPWLPDKALNIIHSYTVDSNRSYRCVVAEVSIEALKSLMERKTMPYGFNRCKVYEYVNTIQFLKCLRLGHLQRAYTFLVLAHLPTCVQTELEELNFISHIRKYSSEKRNRDEVYNS